MLSVLRPVAAAAIVLAFAAVPTPAQEKSPLRVSGLGPGGLRMSVTERWGAISFSVRNPSDRPREARVVVYHDGEDFSEYARDLWVPANAEVTSWMALGPVPKVRPGGKPFSPIGRTLNFILYDKTDGKLTVVPPDDDEKKTRERAVLYRPKSEWSTALFTDEPVNPDDSSFRHPTADEEAAIIVRVMRGLRGVSDYISVVRDSNLPSTSESYDSLDQIVIACNRLKADPHARASLRQWVERGGQLWVMLDQVEVDLLASLLGEECSPQVVDRTSLSRVRFQRTSNNERPDPQTDTNAYREFERPVNFVRVALTGHETVHHFVNGWPASFSIRVGRGRILVTTLGPHGWYRPRGSAPIVANTGRGARPIVPVNDPPSPFQAHPNLPVPMDSLVELSSDLKPVDHPFTVEDLRPLLLDEIGYRVPERGVVIGLQGVFVVSLVGIGVVLYRSRRTEILGWLVPLAAGAIGFAFYLIGGSSRHSIPSTAAVAEVAEAVPGSGEVSRSGIFATFEPTAASIRLNAPNGGVLDFDFEGLEGQNRVRVQTDRESWHFEKLAVPAGVRQGQYRMTATTPAHAVASFGPDGVRGKVVAPGFQNPTDAILIARNRESTAVRFSSDGGFHIGADDSLTPDQFLRDSVLTDRQQRRQSIYRKLLGSGDGKQIPEHYDTRDHVLSWTTPVDLPFGSNDGARSLGSTLLAVPVDYQRPPVGTTVLIPRSFIPFRRWLEGRSRAPTLDSTRPIDMRLRFQLPESVFPLSIQKATISAKIKAPSRRIIFSAYQNEMATKIFETMEPTAPFQVEITDPRYLKLDANGGLHVGIAITGDARVDGILESFWMIESLQLEVTGQTLER